MSRPQRPHNIAIRPLTVEDLPQVLALERHGFPRHEQASPRGLEYRLTVCPELCCGVFLRTFDTEAIESEKLPLKSTIKSERLIAHVIATKMYSNKITDEAMEIPKDFKTLYVNKDNSGLLKEELVPDFGLNEEPAPADPLPASTNATHPPGHTDAGSTIGIHGVIVHNEFRGMKIASLMLKDYLQRMGQQYLADDVALICKSELVKLYQSVGFQDLGISDCHFGGEEWHDMRARLENEDEQDEDDDEGSAN
ncbi:polyamine acetyltransferase [Martiniozyma asiatica (nom. inval.)]|nr:polyamine acetyltransferase [Martiniozyma asiatica]